MTRRHLTIRRALLFFLALAAGAWPLAEWGAGLPTQIHLMLGRGRGYEVRWPVTVAVVPRRREAPVLRLSRNPAQRESLAGFASGEARRVVLYPVREGTTRLAVRLFGVIPLRVRQVTVLPSLRVIPGGQAIGVLVAAKGMIVTGFSPVSLAEGGSREPAREAGVKVGDLLVAVDGRPVYTAVQLETLVNAERGRSVVLEVRRGEKSLKLQVRPARRATEPGATGQGRRGAWRLGIYVEDPTAGVGTLSFWEPRTGVYGALGHMITDGFSRQGVSLSEGRIVPAVIAGVQPGRRGQPGEKIGLFHHSQGVLGTIDRNTACGIFGRVVKAPASWPRLAVPLATREEVHLGPARILTVVEQQQVESFEIEIVRIHRSLRPGGKGLVLHVTDPRLLARTGGIVQGMSGSPILQDGRLVGAVTHVFVNDPTRGYGVLAEWMAWEGGLFRSVDQAEKGESLAS